MSEPTLSSSRSSSCENHSSSEPNETLTTEVKYAINIVINKIFISNDIKEYEFPTSLASFERNYIHKICKLNGLSSITKGKGTKKYVVVTKKIDTKLSTKNAINLSLSSTSRDLIKNSASKFELSAKEKTHLMPKIQKKDSNSNLYSFYSNMYKINNNPARIPVNRSNKQLNSQIDFCKDEILCALNNNRILYIGNDCSETALMIGILLLDYYSLINDKCKILIVEPHDMGVYLTAKKLASELNEELGNTVGFQIANENKFSSNTILTVCSNEFLFRNLISSDESNSVTHIIQNEAHFRDQFSDFNLILLKEKFKNLKLILVGSPLTSEIYQKFFNPFPFIILPELKKTVQEFYLEDILKMINFKTDMSQSKNASSISLLEQWCIEKRRSFKNKIDFDQLEFNYDKSNLDKLADLFIYNSWTFENLKFLHSLIDLIQNHNLDIDYQHSTTKVTPLMTATVSGCIDTVEKLISLNANLFLKSCNNLTCLDWAKRFGKTEIVELLETYMSSKSSDHSLLNELTVEIHKENANENLTWEESLLKEYYKNLKSLIDFNLINTILNELVKQSEVLDSIVIFLPNYESILECFKFLSQSLAIKKKNIKILLIHSEMSINQFSDIINSMEDKCQIILTTGILENILDFTKISIIIDTGFTEEFSFDSNTNLFNKKIVWISKFSKYNKTKFLSNTINNISSYYHLYSKTRLSTLQDQTTPKILSYPTHEICMLAKLISANTSITDTLSKAIDAPPFLQIRNSVNYLKSIDAFDIWEDITEIGVHMISTPYMNLQTTKLLLSSFVLRCLDPILTIISFLIINCDIFENDSNNSEKIQEIKLKFSDNIFSDHIMIYRVYEEWKKSCRERTENEFCKTNFINSISMRRVEFERERLLNYLNKIEFLSSTNRLDELNVNYQNIGCIRAALAFGCYPHIIRVDRKNMQLINDKDIKVKISYESVNWNLLKDNKFVEKFEWLVCDKMYQNSSLELVKRCTLVSSALVCLFCGAIKHSNLFKEPESNEDVVNFKLDNWINFDFELESFNYIMMLKQKWNSLLLAKLKLQTKSLQNDEDCLRLLVDVISDE